MSKDHAEKVEPKSADTAAAIKQTGDDQAQPGSEEGFIPNYHGYTPTQIKVMEDARYDDSQSPPVDDGLDAEREKAAKARQKELDEADRARQRDAEEAEKAHQTATSAKSGKEWK